MAKSRVVYKEHILRAATALQVAVYEFAGEPYFPNANELSDEQALKALEECGREIDKLVKQFVKQERKEM